MKKYAILFAINVLLFGTLSVNSLMSIDAACDSSLTCSDAVGPITWVLAILPIVVLVGVAVFFTPRLLASIKAQSVQRSESKLERVEAHVGQAEVDDSAASRLRRISRTAEESAFAQQDEVGVENEADEEAVDEEDFPPPASVEQFASVDQGSHNEPQAEAVEIDHDGPPASDAFASPEFAVAAAPSSQWDWLLSDDAVRQLRPAADTGFPWVAAMIAETASTIIDSFPSTSGGDFLPEAEAWLAIASELPPAQPITGDDAHSFIGWVNDLAAHSHLMQDGFTLDLLLETALENLCSRADDDAALGASLPASIYTGHGFADVWAKAS